MAIPTLGLGTYVTTDGGSTSLYGSVSLPVPLWDTGSAAGAPRPGRGRRRGGARAVGRGRAARPAGGAPCWPTPPGARRSNGISRRDDGRCRGCGRWPRRRTAAAQRAIFDLLDAFRTQLSVQEQRIELIEALEQARIEVDAAAGFEAPLTIGAPRPRS